MALLGRCQRCPLRGRGRRSRRLLANRAQLSVAGRHIVGSGSNWLAAGRWPRPRGRRTTGGGILLLLLLLWRRWSLNR